MRISQDLDMVIAGDSVTLIMTKLIMNTL